jgi:hypothetical protein
MHKEELNLLSTGIGVASTSLPGVAVMAFSL